ncbi:MAG: hypothetical protein OHK0046_31980 [Anaerolineae bacterium]
MDAGAYAQFTETLITQLQDDPRVVGLVALGSMAAQSRQPDAWSDHDFFVITVPGVQEDLRQARAWLPQPDQIVVHVRETAHGLKVLYANGHLIEFAVFDEAELSVAKVNDYRVLIDKTTITAVMARIAEDSVPQAVDEQRAFSLFISLLLVGAGRYARGEVLSAHRFIKDHALANLLPVLANHLPANNKAVLDNLDAFRRFERVFPQESAALHAILRLDPLHAARELLTFAEGHLHPSLPDYPAAAVEVVRNYLNNIEHQP